MQVSRYAAFFRDRAEEARANAQEMTSAAVRRELLFTAEMYERQVDHAERTAARRETSEHQKRTIASHSGRPLATFFLAFMRAARPVTVVSLVINS